MDADQIEEVVDLEEGGEEGDRPDGDQDDGELADEDVREEDAEDEADVAADATVTDVDNSVHTSRDHAGPVYAVALRAGADGSLTALTGSGDDTGRLWRVEAGSGEGSTTLTPTARLEGHADSVVACGFSSTAKGYAATASYDGTVRVWGSGAASGSPSGAATPSPSPMHVLEGPSADVEWLVWHDKGDVLLAGSADTTAWMWSVSDAAATCMQVFAGHEAAVTCGAFAAQGKLVVTGSADQTLRVWEPKTGKLAMTFSGSGWAEGPITCLATSATTPVVIVGSQDGTARLANVQTKRILGTLAHDPTGMEAEVSASVESVVLDINQNWAYTAGTDGKLNVWDLNTMSRRMGMDGSGGGVKILQAADLSVLAVTTNVGCVDIFDPRVDGLQKRFSGHRGLVLDIARTGTTFVTAGDDGAVKIFDLRKV